MPDDEFSFIIVTLHSSLLRRHLIDIGSIEAGIKFYPASRQKGARQCLPDAHYLKMRIQTEKTNPNTAPGRGQNGQASRSSYLCSINLEPHHSLVKEQTSSSSYEQCLPLVRPPLLVNYPTTFSRRTRVSGSAGKGNPSPEGRLIRVRPSTASSVLLGDRSPARPVTLNGRGWRYIVER